MQWERRVNATLSRTIGYQIARPPGHPARKLPPPEGTRLLKAPVFIMSPARSGSTLLRMILGSHSAFYAPPELPLRQLTVRADTTWIQASMRELQLPKQELDYLLWDRVLAEVLQRGGKPTMVAKTPSNVLIWQQIAECWPDAKFIFLLRHPVASIASLNASWDPAWHPEETGALDESIAKALRYMNSLEEARRALPGHTIRYEDLTAEPEYIVRRLCRFLGVEFEPTMLEYGDHGHGRIASGLGDTSDKIKSGRIQSGTPPRDLGPSSAASSAALARMCAAWGYVLPAQEGATVPAQDGAPADENMVEAATGRTGAQGELCVSG
jgi:hypothetical protein